MATQGSDQLQRLVNRMAFVPLGAIMFYGCFAAFQRNNSVSAQFTMVQTINHKVAPVSRTRVRQSAGLSEPSNTVKIRTPADSHTNPRAELKSRRPRYRILNGPPPHRIGDAEPYDALEEEFLYQLNQYRASNKVSPVRPSVLLSVSAEKLSRELAERGAAESKFDSRTTRTRAQAAGYTANTRFDTIFYTTRADPATMLDLMKVNGNDNRILLDPAWKILGIGRNYCVHDGRWRWVLDFAASFDKTTPMPDEYSIKLK